MVGHSVDRSSTKEWSGSFAFSWRRLLTNTGNKIAEILKVFEDRNEAAGAFRAHRLVRMAAWSYSVVPLNEEGRERLSYSGVRGLLLKRRAR